MVQGSCLGDVHLVRPVHVDVVQTVTGLVSLDGNRDMVVTVEHNGEGNDEVDQDHTHGVGHERPEEEKHITYAFKTKHLVDTRC